MVGLFGEDEVALTRSHGTHRSHELHEATTHRQAVATLGEATRREAELSSGGGGDRKKAAEQRRAAGRQDVYGAATRARIGMKKKSVAVSSLFALWDKASKAKKVK